MRGEELQSQVLIELKREVIKVLNAFNSSTVQYSSTQDNTDFVQTIDRLKHEKKNIYELMVVGELNKKEFLEKKEELDLELDKLSCMLETTKGNQRKSKATTSTQTTLNEMVQEIQEAKELTFELGEKYIKKVSVFPDKTLNVEYMFNELLEIH